VVRTAGTAVVAGSTVLDELRGPVARPPVVSIDGLTDQDAVPGAVAVEVDDQLEAGSSAVRRRVVQARLPGLGERRGGRDVLGDLVGAVRPLGPDVQARAGDLVVACSPRVTDRLRQEVARDMDDTSRRCGRLGSRDRRNTPSEMGLLRWERRDVFRYRRKYVDGSGD
jgi:hypothetical protein